MTYKITAQDLHNTHEFLADYLVKHQLKVTPPKFISFFREEPHYSNFVNKRKGKVTKFLLTNCVVNYDIVAKDFIAHILHPSGASYLEFKINYKVKKQVFNRIERVMKKRISLYNEFSFFSSLDSIKKFAFIFYFKRRRSGALKRMSRGRMLRRFNRRNKRMVALLFQKRCVTQRVKLIPPQKIYYYLRNKKAVRIKQKIKLGRFNMRTMYKFKKFFNKDYGSPYNQPSKRLNRRKLTVKMFLLKTQINLSNRLRFKIRNLKKFTRQRKLLIKKFICFKLKKVYKLYKKQQIDKSALIRSCLGKLPLQRRNIKKYKTLITVKPFKKEKRIWKKQYTRALKSVSWSMLSPLKRRKLLKRRKRLERRKKHKRKLTIRKHAIHKKTFIKSY